MVVGTTILFLGELVRIYWSDDNHTGYDRPNRDEWPNQKWFDSETVQRDKAA